MVRGLHCCRDRGHREDLQSRLMRKRWLFHPRLEGRLLTDLPTRRCRQPHRRPSRRRRLRRRTMIALSQTLTLSGATLARLFLHT